MTADLHNRAAQDARRRVPCGLYGHSNSRLVAHCAWRVASCFHLNLKRQQDKMKATTQALRIVAPIALAFAATTAESCPVLVCCLNKRIK